jgi:hypothetical protein
MREIITGTVAGVVGTVLLLISFIAIAGIALGAGPANATPVGTTQWVVAADIPTGTRAPAGTVSWFADPTAAGEYATTTTAFDGTEALRLTTPAATDGIRVLDSYGSGITPPSIPQIVSGASYTYSGSNVNFQIEIFYTPADPAYGPDPANGANRCTPAGTAFPGQCYTVIKWEPLVSSPSAWRTVDLSVDTPLTATAGGWKNTNRIGIYAKPGPLLGNTMAEYLTQIASYNVLAVGASLGTGTADSVGYLQTISYAGDTYQFRAEPPAPVPSASATVPVSASVPTLAATGAADQTLLVWLGSLAAASGILGVVLRVVHRRRREVGATTR